MLRAIVKCFICVLAAGVAFGATQTENYGISVLPAPGNVTIDGKYDDWDLSGGIFACNNVEEQRDRHSAWLHMMYDKDNLYVLARVKTEKLAEKSGLRMLMLTAPGLLIAVSLYLAWTGAASAGQRRAVAIVFGINLILNAAWPALYFGLQRPLLAFADLTALWLSIIAMIAVTWRIRRASALLLAPYLLWVSFAGVLNWLSR